MAKEVEQKNNQGSPMHQHWRQIKDQHPDCIVFYRLGDFYEMFCEDAVKASKLLDLTLTGRDCGMGERAPMCGVPYHSADTYIAKLVEMGEKVAICEQLEDPATVKAGQIVHRDVIRIVTAGTVTAEEQLDEKANNYICCGYKNEALIALSWADITTGAFSAIEYLDPTGMQKAVATMLKLGVKEVIANDDFLFAAQAMTEVRRGTLPKISNYLDYAFSFATAERILCDQFSVKTLSAFPIAVHKGAVCASGALIEYLKDTQMHALKNITTVNFIEETDYLQLDTSAIRNLELTKNLAEGKKYGSLLWALDRTKTAMGARKLVNIILSPLCNVKEIDYRLNGVDELVHSPVVTLSLADTMHEIKDIERLAGKISNNSVLPKDCISLAESLLTIPNLKFSLSGFTSDILKDIQDRLVDLSALGDYLKGAFKDAIDLPAGIKDGDFIRTGFNAQLDEYRSIRDNGKEYIQVLEKKERDETGIKTLKIRYNRVFGYYIEVTNSFKEMVPLTYQRKQTLANAERYTTEELKGLEVKIQNSEDLAIKMELAIFEYIKTQLTEHIDQLKDLASAIAMLDVLVSFATVSQANRYTRPTIVDFKQPMIIKEGRHPVVEQLSKEKFVANDTLLDEDENRTMIITGPNMAGKSTYMRQTAIIAIMAHIGCFVPAKSAQIPLIDKIFTRVGASDNLIYDQSTFMVEMIEVATILQNATANSLLILDEVGRGTSTYDGLSIAWAVIETITQQIRAKTLFATHYHELTDLENRMEGIKNYKISVKEINGSIVFLRKIMRGGANRSFGIEVAALAGVPEQVTKRAKQILKKIEAGDISHIQADDVSEEEEDRPLPEKQQSEVEKILSETDLNQLSPMQAFMLLGDLIEKVHHGNN